MSGFELEAPGGALRRPLTVSFPAPKKPAGGTVLPVVAHVDDDGAWTYDEARVVGDRFEITTADFSFRAPAWLDPVGWVKGLWAAVAHAVTGRTDPPGCSDARLSWARLDKQTTMLHACLKATPDASKVVRAEAFVKSNRGFYFKVSHTPGAAYVWQQDADTLFAVASTQFLGGADVRIVPPGTEMSVGYPRPSLDADKTVTAYLDLITVALSTLSPIIDTFLPDKRAGFAALYAVKTCIDKVPSRMDDVDGWWNVFSCAFTDALPQLVDERKALAAARSLLGEAPATYSIEGAAALKDLAGKLQLLARAIKVIGLVRIIRDEIGQIADAAKEAGAGQPGSVALHLTAGPLSTDQLLGAQVPPGSCTAGDIGWDDSVPVQLNGGRGQTQVPGTQSWVSILDTQVLGWADFGGDGGREAAMMLHCSGSRIDMCCAGQSSLMWFVAVFKVGSDGRLTRVGRPLSGGKVYPGDQYGPADTAISSATLDGTTIRTEEYVLYPQSYNRSQLGGLDPLNPRLSRSWRLSQDGTWTSSR